MKKTLVAVLLAVGAACAAQAENAMYSCTDAEGSVTLTNVPQGQCEQLFTYAAPVASPAAPTDAQASSARTAGIVGEVSVASAAPASTGPLAANHAMSRSLMSQHRDDVIQQARDAYDSGQAASMANPATSRRYLMTNRVEYQKALGLVQ